MSMPEVDDVLVFTPDDPIGKSIKIRLTSLKPRQPGKFQVIKLSGQPYGLVDQDGDRLLGPEREGASIDPKVASPGQVDNLHHSDRHGIAISAQLVHERLRVIAALIMTYREVPVPAQLIAGKPPDPAFGLGQLDEW